MASIDKHNGHYRVRYRDPLGRPRSRTFRRKVDADRIRREVEVDMDRRTWVDPRKSEMPLQVWSEAFLAGSLSLAPPSLQTYRRDLKLYVLPRTRRPAALAAELRGDRALARRQARQRHLAVVGSPPLPHPPPRPTGRRPEGPPARQPVRQGPPTEGPHPADGDPHVDPESPSLRPTPSTSSR